MADTTKTQACARCGKQFTPAGPVHRLINGDCRNSTVVDELVAGDKINVAVTSPPYASQRKYDESSGFRPIPPEKYVEWYAAVAAGVEQVLAPDGSYFLNIKEHADAGERSLYVKDLVLAHKRTWNWFFKDELCWRKTDNGVPGVWPDRFKNAWEPVFHFSRQASIKFRPLAVGKASEDCFDYSKEDNTQSTSGSGLLGSGLRNKASGIARPSNVVEVKSESGQGAHSAPFPRALVEFFVKAFSDTGDNVFDPFTGSGTTIAAAHVLGRNGYGCEISPQYCDVIVQRISKLTGKSARLAGDGRTFEEVAKERLEEQEKTA